MDGSMPANLFAQVVERSGLSSIFAAKALSRALSNAGVDPARLTPADLERALPEIERMLLTYLDGEEVVRSLKRLAQLVR
jgi:hypothetical protein